ncbi:MAG: transglutaminase family protein [Pirellulaceae bacterium]
MRRSIGIQRQQLAAAICLLAAAAVCLAGCSGEPGQLGLDSGSDSQAAQASPSTETTESWSSLFIGGVKVGHAHTTERFFVENDQPLVETERSSEMSLRRDSQATNTSSKVSCVETRDGQLVRFRSEMRVAGAPLIVTGVVNGNTLNFEVESQGQKQRQEMPWRPTWGGLFAAERSLLSKPMKPGQRRELKSLWVLDFPRLADDVLVAGDEEQTQLLDGPRKLQRIEMTTQIGAQRIQTTSWTDAAGEVVKSQMQMGELQIDSYRTTKEEALKESDGAVFDLFKAANVRVEQRLDRPHATRKVVYRARLAKGDPQQAFVVTASQSVKPIDERTVEITVTALRPETKLDSPFASPPPTEADLKPNALIQSDDPKILALADEAAPREKDPWKVALALEEFVDDYIDKTNFSVALATAAEVAQTHRGDCTEHAMLLAALCRARKIPARLAVGLVYFPQGDAGAFAYHMWTEVWIDDRWIPIDATLAQGGIGAAHLTVAESNLDGGGSIDAFLPVQRVIGDLKLEIVEQQTADQDEAR